MSAPRNKGHTVPVMFLAQNHTISKAKQHGAYDELEDEQAMVEDLNINRQTNRALSVNAKGVAALPRTACWKRFYNNPYHHDLICDHIVKTPTIVACGVNCRVSSKSKKLPTGDMIKCDECIGKNKRPTVSPFIPKKKQRRLSVPSGGMAKMDVDNNEPLFVPQSSIEDDLDTFRAELARAGYGAETRKTIFEPAPPTNPRKRHAVEEPGFHLTDYPTGEPPKRRSSVHLPNPAEVQALRKADALNDDNTGCTCDGSVNEDLLMCVWCDQFFHPTCAGYPDITQVQYHKFSTGFERFYCQGCKEERDKTSKKAVKKAKQTQRANKKVTAAKVIEEVHDDREKKKAAKERRDAKERREKAVKKTVVKSKAKKSGVAEEVAIEEKPLKSILKKTNPPTPSESRFTLSETPRSRRKSMEMEMDLD